MARRNLRFGEELDSLGAMERNPIENRREWIREEVGIKIRLEVKRDLYLFAACCFLLSVFVASAFIVIPVGVLQIETPFYLGSVTLDFVWALLILGCFSILKKTLMPDIRWGWIRFALFCVILAMITLGQFKPSYWHGVQHVNELIRNFRSVYQYMFYVPLLFIALDMLLFFYWRKFKMMAKIGLLFVLPLIAYFILLSWAQSTDYFPESRLLLMKRCGVALVGTYIACGAMMTFVYGLIYYLSERNLSRNYPETMILADLVSALTLLERNSFLTFSPSDSGRTSAVSGAVSSVLRANGFGRERRKALAKKLDRLAAVMEHDLPRVLPRSNPHFQGLAQKQFDRIGNYFRTLKLQILLPRSDSRQILHGILEDTLESVASGIWDDLPRADESDMPPGKSGRDIASSLALGFGPLLIVIALVVLQRWVPGLLGGINLEGKAYLIPAALVWAFVSVGMALDSQFGNKVSAISNAVDAIKSGFGRK